MSIHDVRERVAHARAQVARLQSQVQVSRTAKADCDGEPHFLSLRICLIFKKSASCICVFFWPKPALG
jgi:hypothetical protein